jgi:hypothetical protein
MQLSAPVMALQMVLEPIKTLFLVTYDRIPDLISALNTHLLRECGKSSSSIRQFLRVCSALTILMNKVTYAMN